MNTIFMRLNAALLAGLLGCSTTAPATTGYFALGYGAKSMGLAGATVSNPQDSLAAVSNPAGMGLVGERADFGLRFFAPQRDAELTTTAVGSAFDVADDSRRTLFIIPNIGFTRQIGDTAWWGISIYGNGGLNTTYDRNIYDEALAQLRSGGTAPPGMGTVTPNTSVLGVDLSQAIIAPTVAFKLNEKNTLGLSYLIGVQRFSARGLGNFQCFTNSAATNPLNAASCAAGYPAFPSDSLTNNGNDWSYGSGVRFGWIGEVSPQVTLGLAAASKVYMSELDDYDELFAEDGDFDIPANISAGITVKPTAKLKVSFEYQRIYYGEVDAVANAGPVFNTTVPPLPAPGQPTPPSFDATIPGGGPASEWLGRDDGMGFGWENMNVYRLAMEYQHTDQWSLRAGFSMNDQPIPDDQILFNILAPGTIEKHATLGFTYSPDKNSEWSFAYMHGFEQELDTPRSAFGIPAKINMYQNSAEFAYSHRF